MAAERDRQRARRARAAAPARVLGIDVSEPMLERARQLTEAERLDNVEYELGDAQVHPFEPAGFDVAISRFGTMFFSDPIASFVNIAAALRPEARLVMLVWQRHEYNEWARLIDAALGDALQPVPAGADRSRSATPVPPRRSSSTPGSVSCASRTYMSRSSTETTSTPRSRSSEGFRTPARRSRP